MTDLLEDELTPEEEADIQRLIAKRRAIKEVGFHIGNGGNSDRDSRGGCEVPGCIRFTNSNYCPKHQHLSKWRFS